MSLKSILSPRVISRQRAQGEIFLCVFFWSASFAAMKISAAEIATYLAVWLRILFALCLAVPAAFYRGDLRKPFRDEVLPLLALAFVGVVLHQNIQFAGMRSAGVANSNWLMAVTPAIVTVLGIIFLRERVNLLTVGGLLLSGLGVLLVIGLGTKGLGIFESRGTGDLLVASTTLTWAAFQILSKRFLRGCSPTFAILWLYIFAFLIQTLIACVFVPQDFLGLLDVSVDSWYALLFMGCICSGFCFILWYDGLSVLNASRVSAFQFLQPILGIVIAYFLVGERFTLYIYLGGVMISVGVWLINNAKD